MYICDYANADLWPFFGVSLFPSVFLDIKCVCGSIEIKFSELFLSPVVRKAHLLSVRFRGGSQAETVTAPPVELSIL